MVPESEITDLIPLAIRLSRGFCVRHYIRFEDAPDAYSESLMGLMMAATRYNPQRGVPFPVYANLCISHHLKDYLRLLYRYRGYTRHGRKFEVVGGDAAEIDIRDLPDPDLSPEARFSILQQLSWLRADVLSPRQWEVAVQSLTGTTAEVAQQQGLSEARIHQIRASIRKQARAAVWTSAKPR